MNLIESYNVTCADLLKDKCKSGPHPSSPKYDM